ncbi:DEAD/DEAH box helicase [Microbacterium sp. NPDC091313]
MPAADAASWRMLLPPPGAPSGEPLALGVELRQRDAYDPRRWDPRGTAAVTPRALASRQDELSIAVRPLVGGARGGWIKGDATWDEVRRHPERFAAAHAAWMTELHALAMTGRAVGAFAATAEWLSLDDIVSTHLWPHLQRAAEVGVAIVAAHAQQEVRLAAAAVVGVRLDRAADGGLRVSAEVAVDGEQVDASTVRPLGSAGLFSFTLHRDPIPVLLAPAMLPDPLPVLLREGALEVPAADTAEFLRDAHPVLARRTRVTAAPGLALPAAPRPVLQVTADFRPGHVLAVRSEWVYADRAPVAFDAAAGDDRDRRAEAEIAGHVRERWAQASRIAFASHSVFQGTDAAELSAHVLPALETLADVRVVVTGTRPAYRELTGDPSVRVSTVEGPDPDWFDLGVVVTIEGRTIPFGALFSALSRGRRRMLLADGAYFSLTHPSLARLKELLDEAAELDEWESGPRLSRTQVALWEDFVDLADDAAPARAWRELAEGLRDTASVPAVEAPRMLRAELRAYQRAGLSWLAFLWAHRLGGILADDMGLGKTLQSLALLAHALETGESRPFLVLAPTTLVPTWRQEAERFVPDLVVQTAERTAARSGRRPADLARDAHVVVASYAVLRRDAAAFAEVEWAGVLLDEAQFVKNPRTRLHQAVAALRADAVYALTGTPLENSLVDLWALLSLTAPGLFPSARRFREEYVRPIEKALAAANTDLSVAAATRERARVLARLRRRIRPLVLRRTKDRVAAELPPKQEQVIAVELSPAHRARYDAVLQRERQKVLGLLHDLDRHRFIVFRSLTLLRMLSLAPALLDPRDDALGSAKLDVLVERLVELAAEGHRALVFSQFTSFLRLAADRLEAAGLSFAWLDGSTTQREEVVRGFREGAAPVFLISLKAGGFGLTLTEADYVFLLDPWWNPAAENQAVDRTHRIGQEQPVFVYRLLAAGTIEQKVAALQQRKAELFASVLDDGDAFSAALDADDIRGLLEP